MPTVALENISKAYVPGAFALRDVTLEVADSELLALVGPSGCGKTTLLRLIAGLENASSGAIHIGGRRVNEVSPSERGVGMVFQRPALYPHKTVWDNLAFSLKLQPRPWRWWSKSSFRASCQERVQSTAVVLGLENVLGRYPSQLSGGQQQRVALGRVLVRQPGVILLDEPLSNLDSNLRQELRKELRLLQRQLHTTMICVTHDPLEALSLGDRVAVLEHGRLQQVGPAAVLLRQPANKFVAGFVGWPPLNFLDGEMQSHDGVVVFATCLGRLPMPLVGTKVAETLATRCLTLGISAANVRLVNESVANALPMQMGLVEPSRLGRMLSLTAGKLELTSWQQEGCQNAMPLDIMLTGNKVMVQIGLENALVFDRVSGAALAVLGSG